MRINLNPSSVEDYEKFLKIKSLPRFSFQGRTAIFPDEYAARLGIDPVTKYTSAYSPLPGLFDYQRDIAAMAIRKRKFAIFADCGLGKTLCLLEFARECANAIHAGERVLIISPLMVIKQTIKESRRFYGDSLPIEFVPAAKLGKWLEGGEQRIGITNYEALTDEIQLGKLAALVIDESSMLKSQYGKWGQTIIRLGKGLEWKLACTGTPAPNDRIEYGNHAVFLDAFPTLNSFLARFFVNRGQTDNRWEIKPHALSPFYRALSHWSIFLTNPATYGWKDNVGGVPPINVHMHDVPLTEQQRQLVQHSTGTLYGSHAGGITSRGSLGQIAKGQYKGDDIETLKPPFIRDLVSSWPTESTIIWCLYNAEQEKISKQFPHAANMTGNTPMDEREDMIEQFKAGTVKQLVTKGKILGFGQNLEIATRHVFSALQDSYEMYYQCVKRSNRFGSTAPLNVHIPLTSIERPMVDTVLAKAKRVQQDTIEQEALFKQCAFLGELNVAA